ncbi:uncharacterized protein [Arachis hypogaea]|uniref:uncharacterized protein n=1 Tax=Arachis hypogaea TaxID=3818 RepID=UPI003B20F7C7
MAGVGVTPPKREDSKKDEDGSNKGPSPYDLSVSDDPGNVITQVQLRGENYEEWARAVKVSLRARRKWGFLDGTHKKPQEGASEMEDWWTVQSMLVSWVMNTIEPRLRSTISYTEDAKDLWEEIKERFSIVNGPRIQQLKAELAECKQQGLAMVEYYGKLKTLWDELANHEPVLRCSCGGCKCDIGSRLDKRREEEKVHQFLMGLEDVSYGTVRSNILATDPLPSLNRVYATLVQEERMKMISRTKEDKGSLMGLAVHTGYKHKSRNEIKPLVCSHCGRTGHEIKGCFQLIGYPEWWGDRSRDEKGSNTKTSHKQGGRLRGGLSYVPTQHKPQQKNQVTMKKK